MTWPLATPLAEFGTPAVPDRGIAGLRSGVVLGDDAKTLGPFLAEANALTPIVSGGKPYTIFVRPLLPDESAARLTPRGAPSSWRRASSAPS